MGIRNVMLYGNAYTLSGDVNLLISTASQGEVYNASSLNKIEGVMPGKTDGSLELAGWEIDDETPISDNDVGVITITPTGGDITLVTTGVDKFVSTNFSFMKNFKSIPVKNNATINGKPYNPGPGYDPNNFIGAWHFIIRDGQTMVIDLNLSRLQYSVPGYVYPADSAHVDYYHGDGSPGSGQRNKPAYDPAKVDKMIPSYIPEYSTDETVHVPINIPDPINVPLSKAVGHNGESRKIFRNDGNMKIS